MSEKGGLDISSDTILALYEEAGKEIPYTEAKFTYDSDILMGGLKKTRIQESIDRLGITHQPAEFQVILLNIRTVARYCTEHRDGFQVLK